MQNKEKPGILPADDRYENLVKEYQRVEQELIQAKSALGAQSHQLRQIEIMTTFTRGMAHEFNNLLVPMIGFTKMVQNNLKPGSTDAGYLNRVLKTAYRAKDLATKVRLFNQRPEMKPEALCLDTVLSQVLEDIRETAPQAVKIMTEIDHNTFSVLGNTFQFQQLIWNLYHNAVDAMPNGGILKIKLHNCECGPLQNIQFGERDQPGVCLIFEDTGHGMDVETQRQIFNPFFTTREKGTHAGLGLAIISGFVEQMEGYIDVKSKPGEGAVFNIYIPATVTDAEISPQSGKNPEPGHSGEEVHREGLL